MNQEESPGKPINGYRQGLSQAAGDCEFIGRESKSAICRIEMEVRRVELDVSSVKILHSVHLYSTILTV